MALVAAVALPLIILSAVTLWSQFQHQRSQAIDLLLDQAKGMARLLDTSFERIEQVAHTLANSTALTRGDTDAIQTEITNASAMLAAERPAGASAPEVLVTSPDGQMLLDSAPLADRRYRPTAEVIAMIRAGHGGVSTLQGAPDPARAFVAVVAPVHESSTNPAIGAVLVLPSHALFQLATSGAGIPERAVASVHDQRGVFVSRSSQDSETAGRTLGPLLLRAVAQAASGLVTAGARNINGVPTIVAFARAPDSLYVFKLSIPKSLFIAPLRQALWHTVLTGVAVLGGGLALALMLVRRILRAFRRAVPLGPDVNLLTPPMTGLREADAIGDLVNTMLIERDATLARLHHSTETTRILLERSPVGVVVAVIEGDVLSANDAFLAITGYTRSDLRDGAIHWRHVMPDDWRALGKEAMTDAVIQGARTSYEKTAQRPDGTAVPVLLSFGMINQEAGQVAAFVVDLSSRNEAAAALRESEACYRALAAATREGIVIRDDGRIVEANDAYWRMFGYESREDLIGRDCGKLIAPEARAATFRRIGTAETEPFESIGLRADKTRFPIEIHGYPIQHHGRIMRVGIVRDLTRQKHDAAVLRETEAGFQALADSMPQLVWCARPDGGSDYFNARCREFTGRSAGTLLNEKWHNLVHPDDAPALRERWRNSLRTGEPYEAEARLRRHDGVYRWMLVRALPVRHPETGEIRRWFGSCTDITEFVHARDISARGKAELETLVDERTQALRDAEHRLAHSERMQALGQLAGGIAHDFNNVLQTVLGGGALIERRSGHAADVRRYAALILQAAERGAAITRRLLAFSRRADLRAEPVEPAPLLAALQDILIHTLGSGIDMRMMTEPGLPPMLVDRNQLETVLVNLATNARDAMAGFGSLGFAADQISHAPHKPPRDPLAVREAAHPGLNLSPGSYIRISVTDTGTGMDAATLLRATEPFFTTKAHGKGTGLGLAMARGFAEQSGGGLHIASTPGQGTTVTLYLPVAPKVVPAADAHMTARFDRPQGPTRLLLVDDDPGIREVVGAQMRAAGLEVIACDSSMSALARLDGGAIADVLVSDLTMPQMDGLALIREARGRQPDLPAILLTGNPSRLAELALEAARSDVVLLRKPVTGEALAEKIAGLLEDARI